MSVLSVFVLMPDPGPLEGPVEAPVIGFSELTVKGTGLPRWYERGAEPGRYHADAGAGATRATRATAAAALAFCHDLMLMRVG